MNPKKFVEIFAKCGASRLAAGDTAGWQPALRCWQFAKHPIVYKSTNPFLPR